MRIAATFLITATILLSITAPTGCLAPSLPPKDVPDVHATEIVDECIFNKPRAKDRYLHRWFNITTGPIVEISGDRGPSATTGDTASISSSKTRPPPSQST